MLQVKARHIEEDMRSPCVLAVNVFTPQEHSIRPNGDVQDINSEGQRRRCMHQAIRRMEVRSKVGLGSCGLSLERARSLPHLMEPDLFFFRSCVISCVNMAPSRGSLPSIAGADPDISKVQGAGGADILNAGYLKDGAV